jgi:hypothetical protein
MGKLKNLWGTIGTAAVLTAGQVAEAQSNQTETLLGADLKVSTRIGQVGLYSSFGPYIRPTTTTYFGTNQEQEILEWTMPTSSTSFKFGVEVGKKNKVVAGIDIDGGASEEEKSELYNKTKVSIGYKREIALSKKVKLSANVGAFYENRHFGIPGQSSRVYSRRGTEFGLGYEHALTDNIHIFGHAGFSANIDQINFLGDNRPNDIAATGPNNALSINVGVHYKFRPEIPEVSMDDLFPKRKSSYKTPRRKKVKSKIPCHSYKTDIFPGRNSIFNRP